MKTLGFTLLWISVMALTNADDSCPEVKIIGVGDSDRLSILRGCPGIPGSPEQKGDSGEKGEPGPLGAAGKMGPTGQKGEPGAQGVTAENSARDCKELQDRGEIFSDWYTIFPDGKTPLKVLCDMHTEGGGWIVFQSRWDGSVDFSRDWTSYKIGFGNRMNEFWLGNENLHRITSSGSWTLRVDFQDLEYTKYFAEYASIKVLGESEKYKLLLGNFTGGNAGDSMTYHNNNKFSTLDQDNDLSSGHCAQKYMAGWWYGKCFHANLNGHYLHGEYNRTLNDGVIWKTGKGLKYSYKYTEMKIRKNK